MDHRCKKAKVRKDLKERGCGKGSKVNKFGVSLLESLGLAKHSRDFETSGLVNARGQKQGGFKSLNRNRVEGLKLNHKYLKSAHRPT